MKYFSYPEALDKEYKYKILVYPNITYMRDLEKDSYIVVLRNVIKELNKIRDDIHWTILSPFEINSLVFDNTEQLKINLPSYPNAMRTHFNHSELMYTLNWKHNDFDVVYSHLPEHTLQLTNMFANETNISPKFVGYCHWFEVKENTAYSKTMLPINLTGILQMEECGVNSIWLKNLILKKSKEWFNDDTIDQLDKIIQPHYLGVDNILEKENTYTPKTILFNHRDNEYTGWKWFGDQMDKLWKQRQDFTVYTTLADLNKPYARRVKIHDRNEYLKFISEMYIGVSCFEKYSAWSISTTDSLSQRVPYLLPNKLCYPEMVGSDYPMLYNRSEFLSKLNNLLDDTTLRNKANNNLKSKIDDFKWSQRVPNWFNSWDFLNNLETVGDTESYRKIVDYIHKKKSVTKNDILRKFNWGVRVQFNGYRNRLRTESTIKFTKDRYEVK